ncbi:MAG: M20/M25/M40 family metallo-hydrolase [Mariniphaga sp.]
MKTCYSPIFLSFFLSFCITSNAQHFSAHDVSEENLGTHIQYLASDSLKGRGINSPELNIAAEYIKDNLRYMEMSGFENGFFQPFTLTSLQADKGNSFLKVLNKRGKEKKSIQRFIAFNQNVNDLDIQGELVFAGFGMFDSFAADNNLRESDIKDKIILYSAGTPETFREGSAHKFNNALERDKMKKMQDAGAKAVILVTSIQDSSNTTYNQILHMTERQKYTLEAGEAGNLPDIFIINPETADKITGRKMNWGKTLQAISASKEQKLPALKNNRVHIRSVISEQLVEAKNVVALVEGSDSLLKDECITYVAHYDHLGTGKNGAIYNGADDNASGVATLLEVARMFSQLPEKPKRSILFLFPSAEEIGLYGSEYYSQNPLFPMEKTVACINLDMVGRVYEERDSVWSGSPKQVKDFNGIYALVNDFSLHLKELTTEVCSSLQLEPDFSLPSRFFYNSDHYHFHKNKVPVLNISTGYSADYHKPTDTADRVRTDKIKRIAQLCFQAGMELANQEE